MEKQKDKLDVLIGSRIAERQRKLHRLQEMNRGNRKPTWVKFTPLAVAACLVAALVIDSLVPRTDGLQEAYRAASPEIQQLVECDELDSAHTKVLQEIHEAQSAISQLEQLDTTDEEIAYELEAERLKMNDLRHLEKEISKKMK